MDLLAGIYLGLVENNRDPEKLGRLKVRVPYVYGILGGSTGAVPVDDLPWALPFGLPAGGSNVSGGCSWLPEPGDQVMVQFLDGEPEKPVWTWSMQTVPQAAKLKLHQHDTGAKGTVGPPKRAAWTRYGHVVEWNRDGIILTTANGYRLLLTDSDLNEGQVMLSSSAGQFLSLDDDTRTATLNVLEDFYMVIGQELNISAADVRLDVTTGSIQAEVWEDITLDLGRDFNVTALGKIDLSADADLSIRTLGNLDVSVESTATLDFATLLLGTGAVEPFVLGTQLVAFLESLLLWASTHTHLSAVEGTPTSPPIVPPVGVVQPDPTQLTSQTIFGH